MPASCSVDLRGKGQRKAGDFAAVHKVWSDWCQQYSSVLCALCGSAVFAADECFARFLGLFGSSGDFLFVKCILVVLLE